MQRMPQNTMPPRGRQPNQGQNQGGGQPNHVHGGHVHGGHVHSAEQHATVPPALAMARRIRMEQGEERAKQYLLAMEPFLAPAERMHIAQQLGITLPERRHQEPLQHPPEQPFGQGAPMPFPNMPFGQGGLPFLNKGGMNNPLQMMQLISNLRGMGKPNGGPGDPAALAQMFGSLLGKNG